MPAPLHTIVETPEFLACARNLFTEEERRNLIDFLAHDPISGDLMQGTGGARKLRWGARGKGKRGGARVITFYAGPRVPVFILSAFGKGERVNLSKSERNALREVLATLVAEYERA